MLERALGAAAFRLTCLLWVLGKVICHFHTSIGLYGVSHSLCHAGASIGHHGFQAPFWEAPGVVSIQETPCSPGHATLWQVHQVT